jgi:hypothetical protein
MPARFEPPPELRRLGRLGLLVVLLLGTDIALSWMVLQGAHVFLGLVWHALAREFLPGSVEAHAGQFRTLRLAQAAAWIATAAAFAAWLSRVRRHHAHLAQAARGAHPAHARAATSAPRAGPFRLGRILADLWRAGDAAPCPGGSAAPRRAPGVAWWLGALGVAGLGEALAAVLAGGVGTPLDLGGAMQVLILTQLVEIAAAVLAIVLVRRVHLGQEAMVRSRSGRA